ncbi:MULTISPECIES: hypothetical protein [unclassified Psychrobacillus]|uniref:hypothetical protein n=1 Tax=unclassified Psychrobacillus TaxID=2636677 RepID=UPI0030F9CEF8
MNRQEVLDRYENAIEINGVVFHLEKPKNRNGFWEWNFCILFKHGETPIEFFHWNDADKLKWAKLIDEWFPLAFKKMRRFEMAKVGSKVRTEWQLTLKYPIDGINEQQIEMEVARDIPKVVELALQIIEGEMTDDTAIH